MSDHVKVIGVSAAVNDTDRANQFATACDDFVAKPVELDDLLEKLRKQLQIGLSKK